MSTTGNRKKSVFTYYRLITVIVAVILVSVIVIFYTNRTLHSIENKLPSTLLSELNSLSTALDSISDVVSSARIAAITKDRHHIDRLRSDVETAHQRIVDMRNTYVRDNLVHASFFHAVAAPAIVDVRIWLEEGVSGFGPESDITLTIVESRIREAYDKLSQIMTNSRSGAQKILDNQRQRLETFQKSVNTLFAFNILLVCILVILLVNQKRATMREAEARNELHRHHYLLDSLLQNLPQGIAVWDSNLDIVSLNESFSALTGYEQKELLNMRTWTSVAYPNPEYRREVVSHWKKHSRKGEICEYRITCKDGSVKHIEFMAVYLPDKRVITTLNDVTERNRREKELQESRQAEARAKKMESLGLLAGGVAHDLNNILSGIVSYPELILLELPPDDRLRKPIEIVRESGLRASAIVQDLLTVARGVAVDKEPLNLNAVIDDYLCSPDFEEVRHRHPEVEVECVHDDSLVNIMGSQVHIRKILMNLVSNGCEAIEGSGTVRIETVNRKVDEKPESKSDNRVRMYVDLIVADQGKGISTPDLEKIFEPFYSKKVMGRSGTGLGLTVVWNVVEDHHGVIDVKSTSEGTVFTVSFPGTLEPVRRQIPGTDLSRYEGHGESVLVVDDVSSQRDITCSILEKLGYRAESVSSGEAAVEFIRSRSVDLVILDMIMSPGISGRETYERILALSPGQKALIISGYSETDDVRETLRLGADAFLKKPLMIGDLAVTLKTLLTKDSDSVKGPPQGTQHS